MPAGCENGALHVTPKATGRGDLKDRGSPVEVRDVSLVGPPPELCPRGHFIGQSQTCRQARTPCHPLDSCLEHA